MKINKSQQMMLSYLKESKDSGPSLLRIYKLCWKCNLALLFILVLLFSLDLKWGFSIQSFIFYGFVLGAIFRDFAMVRKQKKNWKINKEIINWDKVNDLLKTK
jgi:hypothetical protein